jgi:hypothetical protein
MPPAGPRSPVGGSFRGRKMRGEAKSTDRFLSSSTRINAKSFEDGAPGLYIPVDCALRDMACACMRNGVTH